VKLREIISKINPESIAGDTDLEIQDICYDSRKAGRGSLFVAIRGFKTDGHQFIGEAYQRGARAFIVEKMLLLPSGAVLIKVPSSRKALARVSNVFYQFPSQKLRLIGVTGTNGKTTLTYLLQSIFKKGGLKVGRLSTVDYDVEGKIYPAPTTTPESLDLQRLLREMVNAKVKYVAMEVSSHSLVLSRVEGVDFDWAIFTNLSPEHLDFHGTMENYLRAKMILFETLSPDKKALINLDDPYSEKIIEKTPCEVVTYGIKRKVDYLAEELKIKREGSSFQVKIGGKDEHFQIYLPGVHNIYNALAAIAVAVEEEIPLQVIKEGLKEVKKIPGRLEPVKNKTNLNIYIDYAHTPHSLEGTLKTLGQLTSGKLVVVFGCGGNRDPYKRPLMGKIALKIADFTVITSDNPRSEDPEKIISQIEKGMLEEGAKKGRDYTIFVDRREAIKYALSQIKTGDTLLIAGKGHERVQIFKDRVVPFNDVAIVRDLLRESDLL
jgi:UDP-N-acetylmuramoyl-L-alanyl-D-glutamate--2,6-diaminopimelate ligase